MNTKSMDENGRPVTCCCGISAGIKAAFWGSVLILLGVFSLLGTYAAFQHLARYILPAFLILWGVFILFSRFLKRSQV